jgi:hypothetical protein
LYIAVTPFLSSLDMLGILLIVLMIALSKGLVMSAEACLDSYLLNLKKVLNPKLSADVKKIPFF